MKIKKTLGKIVPATKKLLIDHPKEASVALLFLLAYVPTFEWMWNRWFVRDSYYSHGILIPFFAAYLIWLKRDKLKKIKPTCSKWGIKFIVAGLVIHIVSSMLRVSFTSGFSMLMVFFGLILHFYGGRFCRTILFPISFLFFMIPLPSVLIVNISFKLKIFAASIATDMLNNINIPAIQEGSLIKMTKAYVVVDDVCSGLRSLISLTALGSVFAYWMSSSMSKRVVIFLSTIPIAIVTNVCRIVFLSFVAEVWGPQFATGITHDFSGFLVFALAFLLLFTVGRVLE